jgi:hypothetical protein
LGGLVIDHAKAQAISNEQHDIVGLRRRRLRECSGADDGLQDCRTEQKRQTHGETPGKTG